MPRPSLRTRSKKRHLLRLPGGRIETHYGRGKTNLSRCSRCGQALSGVPSLSSARLHRLSASQRKPERMYGGTLCPRCLRDQLKRAVRSA